MRVDEVPVAQPIGDRGELGVVLGRQGRQDVAHKAAVVDLVETLHVLLPWVRPRIDHPCLPP